jgi:hypothetical protein
MSNTLWNASVMFLQLSCLNRYLGDRHTLPYRRQSSFETIFRRDNGFVVVGDRYELYGDKAEEDCGRTKN